MCGSYSSSKTTLLGLNVIYFVLSLIMIGIAVNGKKQILNPNSLKVKITLFSAKVSGLVTSLPIIGGITASGVFLLFLAVVGIIGLMKNHQVMLYVYMIILFFIFIIQFSCSCAALSVSSNDQMTIIKGAWNQAVKHDSSKSLIVEAERQLDCCGLGLKDDNTFYQHPTPEDHEWSVNNTVFTGNWKRSECANIANINTTCTTCFPKISSKVRRILQ